MVDRKAFAQIKYRNTGINPLVIEKSYPKAIKIAKKVGRELGYAIAVHGSLTKDLDLLAVPWTDEAKNAYTLAKAITKAVNGRILVGGRKRDTYGMKPHGRKAWTIVLSGMGNGYIDLSVMPRRINPSPKG